MKEETLGEIFLIFTGSEFSELELVYWSTQTIVIDLCYKQSRLSTLS